MSKLEPILNVNSISRISEGTRIKGEINSPYDIRLDGEFEGKVVSSGKVIIGEKAAVKGDIVCGNMDVYGKIDGNIFVREVLALKQGCEVNGNLCIRRLIVELDSSFNGNCRMVDGESFDKAAGIAAEAE